MHRLFLGLLICFLLLAPPASISGASAAPAAAPRNILLFIGDGMGPEQVRAASYYLAGASGALSFESFPYQAMVTTHSANNPVTDSAAGATAYATGRKVNNGVVSIAAPGDGSDLPTLLELFSAEGKRTGLVTTVEITHATPAAFGAHEPTRNNRSQIGVDYLTQSRPHVLLGGGDAALDASDAATAGYTVVTTRAELQALDADSVTYVYGQFGTTHLPYEYDYATGSSTGFDTLPHLHEMTEAALDMLDDDPDGLFLMVEGGHIDLAGHLNNRNRNVHETLEFSRAVQVGIDWAATHPDTLIIVTADHETGGMQVTANNGAGVYPTVTWSTTGHTAANVPIYAQGPYAQCVAGILDNITVFSIIREGIGGDCTSASVTLASFRATAQEDAILLQWETVSEVDNLGFNLLRGTTSHPEEAHFLNSDLIPSQAPGSGQGFRYEWRDEGVEPETAYYYWLESVAANGERAQHGPVSAMLEGPSALQVVSLSALELRSWIGPSAILLLLGAGVGYGARRRLRASRLVVRVQRRA